MLLSGAVMQTADLASKKIGDLSVTASLGTFIDSDSSGNFKLKYAKLVDGVATNEENFSINFDDGTQNFVRKKISTNPTLLTSGNFYPTSAEKDYWLGKAMSNSLETT